MLFATCGSLGVPQYARTCVTYWAYLIFFRYIGAKSPLKKALVLENIAVGSNATGAPSQPCNNNGPQIGQWYNDGYILHKAP